ncbi:MAG: adenosylmethionine--8-amino-7-oxononanoate transaminase [Pseudomonadota bacterium]|nr:adenosylmethionine--8-amino-7-oxononanoate transaminase [Pseudomonadota bacterium]
MNCDNLSFIKRSHQAVWHPCTQMKAQESLPPLAVSRGEGIWLYDYEGKRYLDAISSWWVNLFGHCHPFINAALTAQLNTLEHAMLAGLTHEPVIRLSERLSEKTGGSLGHCFYGSDGSSATEIALKMSVHYWQNRGRPGKTRFISLEKGYHGETIGALSVTDVPMFRQAYSSMLRPNLIVQSPDSRLAQSGETAQGPVQRALLDLEKTLKKHHDSVAAFIVEPLVQGAAGMGMYPAEYLKAAGELCRQFRVHFIADEIAVGFGRTGTFFACEQAGVIPDLLCLSKGITGGYLPLSVVLSSDDIFSAFYDVRLNKGFLHSHSYTGNALACAAANAVLDLFEQAAVLQDNQIKAARMNELCIPIKDHPDVRHFRHMGMIWAFEVKSDRPGFSDWFHEQAKQKELLIRPIGHSVYFMPPYIINEEDMHHLVNGVMEILAL